MLTIEDIKKGCEFADGFEIKKDSHSDDNDSLVHVDEGLPLRFLTRKNVQNTKRWKNSIYPLFLQRVIEGINKEEGAYYLEIGIFNTISVVNSEDGSAFVIFKAGENIDTAKTQAIKYILDKLK